MSFEPIAQCGEFCEVVGDEDGSGSVVVQSMGDAGFEADGPIYFTSPGLVCEELFDQTVAPGGGLVVRREQRLAGGFVEGGGHEVIW